MKHQIYIVVIFSFLFSSCSYENDLFEAYKDSPFLMFNYKGQNFDLISDSLKVPSNQLGETAIDFELKINDKANYLKISYELSQGVGEFYVNSKPVEKQSSFEIPRGNHSGKYVPEKNGKHILKLFLSDLYGNTVTKEINLLVFSNLPPKAQMSVKNISQYSKYEIEIDASASYDLDEKWGGKVQSYIYKIGSYYTLETEEFSTIKHILPSSGKYVISLQVRDNDNVLSEPVFHEVNL